MSRFTDLFYITDKIKAKFAQAVQPVFVEGGKTNIRTATGDSVDVFIQDQNTPIVNMPLHQDLGNVTLAAPAVADAYTVTLQAGHGASAGEVLFLIRGPVYYYGLIQNVAVNVITLDTPLCFSFPVTSTAVRASVAMNVDGSGAPITFHALPPPGVPAWDITRITLKIIDDAAMDYSTFGGIAALTNGIHLRKNNGDGTYNNIGNAKTNGNLSWLCEDADIQAKVGGGEWAFTVKCIFQPAVGVTFRLEPALNEELEVIVQDDLRALSSFQVAAQGHVVEN